MTTLKWLSVFLINSHAFYPIIRNDAFPLLKHSNIIYMIHHIRLYAYLWNMYCLLSLVAGCAGNVWNCDWMIFCQQTQHRFSAGTLHICAAEDFNIGRCLCYWFACWFLWVGYYWFLWVGVCDFCEWDITDLHAESVLYSHLTWSLVRLQ
jgi:hypothetical protein